MNTEPQRSSEPPGGRERALVEQAWQQAEAARRAEHDAGSAVPQPGGVTFTGPPPDSFTGYTLVGELHRGGQGVVYQAIQKSTQRKVAIKVMREGPFAGAADRARFDREVHILGQLDHPHIVTIHDTGSAAGHLYFVMDYIPGQTLDVYMAGGEHTLEETLRLFAKICEAVNAAHLRGVIHRDLKPSNIRVDPEGEPHVLDFGLAKVATSPSPPLEGGDVGGVTAMTLTGQFVGSLPWASPEQAEGQPAKIDLRTDVYSLGVTLYQMLTGRFPYPVIGPMRDVLDNILTAEPARPSAIGWHGRPGVAAGLRTGRWGGRRARRIDDEIDTIVLKCLQKERDRRYQTAGELARDVQHYLNGEPIEAKRNSAGYLLRKQLFKYRLPVAIAAGFLAVITAGLLTSLVLWGHASDERDRAVLAEREQVHAREEAEQARDRAQTIADFQSSMLAETDAQGMGLAIVDGFEQRIREVLSKQVEDPGEVDRVLHDWRRQTLKAGPTNVALAVLDEFVLGKAAKTIEKDFADQPRVRAALQQTLGDTYREIGLHEPAMALQQAALQTRREELGDDHLETLSSIHDMGALLHAMGRADEAKQLVRAALDRGRSVLGNDHPLTMTLVADLGFLLTESAHYEDALPYARESLEGRRRVLGDEDPQTLLSINNMGYLLALMGRLTDAEPYYREALETRRRVLGDDHPETLGSLNNMAYLIQHMGRLSESEPLWREVVEGVRRVLGDNHPLTLLALNNMGGLLLAQGKPDEAEPHYRAALEGTRRVLGDDHPQTLLSINNMGYLLAGMGRPADAEPYYRAALEARRRVLGNEHPDTINSLHNVSDILRELGRLEEAAALGAELVRGARRSFPDGHAYIGMFLTNYGKTLAALERYPDAESTLLEAHELLAAAFGLEKTPTMKVVAALAELYGAWHAAEPDAGHDARAAEWRVKLEEWQASTQPAESEEATSPASETPAAGQ